MFHTAVHPRGLALCIYRTCHKESLESFVPLHINTHSDTCTLPLCTSLILSGQIMLFCLSCPLDSPFKLIHLKCYTHSTPHPTLYLPFQPLFSRNKLQWEIKLQLTQADFIYRLGFSRLSTLLFPCYNVDTSRTFTGMRIQAITIPRC